MGPKKEKGEELWQTLGAAIPTLYREYSRTGAPVSRTQRTTRRGMAILCVT